MPNDQLNNYIKISDDHFNVVDKRINVIQNLMMRIINCQIILFSSMLTTLGISLMDASTVIETFGQYGISEKYLYLLATSLSILGVVIFTVTIRYLWVTGMLTWDKLKDLITLLYYRPQPVLDSSVPVPPILK